MIKTYQAENIAGDAHHGIAHGFFTRRDGVSTGIYNGLNVGLGSSDISEAVEENRRLALAHLSASESTLCTAYQIHSADVAVVNEPWSPDGAPRVDAMVTSRRGVALGILTADCAPVLFADAEAGVIGAAHAGWKGALGGVVEATLEAMEGLGADRGNIAAAIGPAIVQGSYEVGPEFRAEFTDPESGGFFLAGKEDRFLFDLVGYVANRLKVAGIESAWSAGLDTYKLDGEFYSYRRSCHREESDYGRQLSAILLV